MAVKRQYSSFEELIQQAEVPVLVDFYSPTCGPCQAMSPILEEVGAQLRDRVQVVKINVDRYGALAMQHRVQAVPTLVLFKGGRPVDRFEGLLPAAGLLERVRPHL